MVAVPGEATLLLDGTDIEDLTECVEGPITWPYQGFTSRGDLPQFFGVDGAANVDQPYDVSVLPITTTLRSPACSGGAVVGSGQLLRVALNELRDACRPSQVVTLTRLWPDGTSEQALAKFLNITPTRPVKNVMSCLVEFTLLELWYGPAVTGGAAAGTHSIAGTTRTHRIDVTLAAGAARTVTNTTNGFWFTYGATVPTGGVVVDVEARTATALIGGTDLSRYLSWGKFFPFRLDRGSNTITVSTGSASFVYQPAYL